VRSQRNRPGRIAGACLLAAAVSTALAAVEERRPIAVLPIENLSGSPAPLDELHEGLVLELRRAGLPVLDGAALEAFMARHRMRYVGGLSEGMALALAEETGAAAALVTSLDLYFDREPPAFGLIARLVSTGEEPRILWMDDLQVAGDQAPGLLGTGRVADVAVLQRRTLGRLGEALFAHLQGEGSRRGKLEARRRFRPQRSFGRPFLSAEDGAPLRVAVLPFANHSTSPRAGEILGLHFVRQLSRLDDVTVIEPGHVRQALLQGRLIRQGGVSLPQADLLRALLEADLVLSGDVRDYEDQSAGRGVPFVNFGVRVIDARRGQSAWTSVSFGGGGKGVVFFDVGRVHTAHALASEMVRGVVRTAERRSRKRK